MCSSDLCSAGDGLARGFYTPWNDDFTTMTVVYAGQTVNGVSLHLGQYQEMKAMSLDPYVAFRNGYAQLGIPKAPRRAMRRSSRPYSRPPSILNHSTSTTKNNRQVL